MERLAADSGEQTISHFHCMCVFFFFLFSFFFFSENRLGWFGKLTSESTKVDNVKVFFKQYKTLLMYTDIQKKFNPHKGN